MKIHHNPEPIKHSLQFLKFEAAIDTVRASLMATGTKEATNEQLAEYINAHKSPALIEAESTLDDKNLSEWIEDHRHDNIVDIKVQEYIDNLLNPMIVSFPQSFNTACRSLAIKLRGILVCEGMDAISSLYDIRVDIVDGRISEMDAINFSMSKWQQNRIPLSLWLYGSKGAAVWYAYYRLLALSGRKSEYGGKYRSKSGKMIQRSKVVLERLPDEEESEERDSSPIESDVTAEIEKFRGSSRLPEPATAQDEALSTHEYRGTERILTEPVERPDWMPREEERKRGELLKEEDRVIAELWARVLDKELVPEERRQSKLMLLDKFDSINDLVNWINDKVNILLEHYRRVSRDKGGWIRHKEPLPKLFDNIIRRAKDVQHSRRSWNIKKDSLEVLQELLNI